MNTKLLDAPGELYLGSDRATALALGARRFGSARKAIAFAMEQAAPVSLRGAMLRVGDQTFEPSQIVRFHQALSTTAH